MHETNSGSGIWDGTGGLVVWVGVRLTERSKVVGDAGDVVGGPCDVGRVGERGLVEKAVAVRGKAAG